MNSLYAFLFFINIHLDVSDLALRDFRIQTGSYPKSN